MFIEYAMVEIYADNMYWCSATSTSQKSEVNKFMEVFANDGVRCLFWLSYVVALLLAKKAFFMF